MQLSKDLGITQKQRGLCFTAFVKRADPVGRCWEGL